MTTAHLCLGMKLRRCDNNTHTCIAYGCSCENDERKAEHLNTIMRDGFAMPRDTGSAGEEVEAETGVMNSIRVHERSTIGYLMRCNHDDLAGEIESIGSLFQIRGQSIQTR
jgi:hypothetical protein